MRSYDLTCNDCRHRYQVGYDSNWIDEEKLCPKCGSDAVHQGFRSYLRNGPLIDAERTCNAINRSCCCGRDRAGLEGTEQQDS